MTKELDARIKRPWKVQVYDKHIGIVSADDYIILSICCLNLSRVIGMKTEKQIAQFIVKAVNK